MHSSSSSSFICSSFSFRPSRPTLAFTSQRGRLPERTIGTTITSRRAVMGPSSSAVPRASKSSLGTPLSPLPGCVSRLQRDNADIPRSCRRNDAVPRDTLRQPSSIHAYAKPCRGDSFEQRVHSRDWCKKWPKEVLFTGCGTESDVSDRCRVRCVRKLFF